MLAISLEGAVFNYKDDNKDAESNRIRFGIITPHIVISSELFNVGRNPVILNVGTGIMMSQLVGKNIGGFIRAGIGYEFKHVPAYVYDEEEYKKKPKEWKIKDYNESEDEGKDETEVKEEGETVW